MAEASDDGFDQAGLFERQTQVEQAQQRLEKRLDTMDTDLIGEFTDIRALIDDRYLKLQGQIAGLDWRVGGIEKRLDGFDHRFDRIDGNLTSLGSKLDRFIDVQSQINRAYEARLRPPAATRAGRAKRRRR